MAKGKFTCRVLHIHNLGAYYIPTKYSKTCTMIGHCRIGKISKKTLEMVTSEWLAPWVFVGTYTEQGNILLPGFLNYIKSKCCCVLN